MINIISRIGKLRYQVMITRKMIRFERLMFNETFKVIRKQYLKVANLVRNGDTQGYLSVNDDRKKLIIKYAKDYQKIVLTFAGDMLKDFDKLEKNISLKSEDIDIWESLKLWVKVKAVDDVVLINNTTKKRLKRLIKKNIEEGKTHEETAKAIKKTAVKTSRTRAKLIARTQVHTVANNGMLKAVKSTKYKTEKEWLNAGDSRVRDQHLSSMISPDVRIPVEESWNVDGYEMEYPGDPSGGIANIANCRCAVMYHVV